LDKAKPGTGNTRGLNLAAVKRTTVQVTRLPLQPELPKVGHDLLFSAWTDRGLVYIYEFFLTNSNCIYTIYWRLTIDGLRLSQMTDPTPRQRGRPTDKPVTVEQYQTTRHAPQAWLTGWPSVVTWLRLAVYSACHLLICWFLLKLFLRPWRWRRYVPPKRRLQLNRLHSVTSQKMILFK
jgi:hypothetical protein